MTTSDWISMAALAISLLTAIGSGVGWYRTRFRYSEVLDWSLQSVSALQCLYIAMERGLTSDQSNDSSTNQSLIIEAASEVSVLIEVGRVFFRNSKGKGALKGWGSEKPSAYQGLRPKLLDYLVAAYDAAQEWRSANTSRKGDLRDAVLEAERQFVTLVQCEVGRAKTLAPQTRQAGKGSPLVWVLRELREREAKYGKRNLR